MVWDRKYDDTRCVHHYPMLSFSAIARAIHQLVICNVFHADIYLVSSIYLLAIIDNFMILYAVTVGCVY